MIRTLANLVVAMMLFGMAPVVLATDPWAPQVIDPLGDAADPIADFQWIWLEQTTRTTVRITALMAAAPPAEGRACDFPGRALVYYRFDMTPVDANGKRTVAAASGEWVQAVVVATCEAPSASIPDRYVSWSAYLERRAANDTIETQALRGGSAGERVVVHVDLSSPLLAPAGPAGPGLVRLESLFGVSLVPNSMTVGSGSTSTGPIGHDANDRAPDTGTALPFIVGAPIPPRLPEDQTLSFPGPVSQSSFIFPLTPAAARGFLPVEPAVEPWFDKDGLGVLTVQHHYTRASADDPTRYPVVFIGIAIEPPPTMAGADVAPGRHFVPVLAYAAHPNTQRVLASWNLPVIDETVWRVEGLRTTTGHPTTQQDDSGFFANGSLEILYAGFGGGQGTVPPVETSRFFGFYDGALVSAVDVLVDASLDTTIGRQTGVAFLTIGHLARSGVPLVASVGLSIQHYLSGTDDLRMSFVNFAIAPDKSTHDADEAQSGPQSASADDGGGPRSLDVGSWPVAVFSGASQGVTWIAWGIGGTALASLVYAGVLSSRAVGPAWTASWVGFSRLTRANALEHEGRARLFEFARHNPGAAITDAARGLEMNPRTANYYARRLSQAGLIGLQRDGARVRMFTGPGRPPSLTVDGQARRVLDAVTARPGIDQACISNELELSRESVYYHVRRLVRTGALRVERSGRNVRHFATD